MRRTMVAALGLVLAATVALMAVRVGEQARFVTWPVVAFTALAVTVAMVGGRAALAEPSSLAIGVLPGLLVAYLLPAAPLWFVAAALVLFGALAVQVGGPAAGMATFTALALVALVVIQDPAVECHESGVSSNSGPWWVESPSHSSSSGSGGPDGAFSGDAQVGEHRYGFRCEGGELVSFERVD